VSEWTVWTATGQYGGYLDLTDRGGRYWITRAACAGQETGVFFTGERRGRTRWAAVASALQSCDKCPVVRECLTDALAYGDEFGVRGGLTAGQRVPLHRQVTALRKQRTSLAAARRGIAEHAEQAWADNHAHLAQAEEHAAAPGGTGAAR
jgi:WhiB family redox-sensing transcriptional regulator